MNQAGGLGGPTYLAGVLITSDDDEMIVGWHCNITGMVPKYRFFSSSRPPPPPHTLNVAWIHSKETHDPQHVAWQKRQRDLVMF